jgi:hypothetical protein
MDQATDSLARWRNNIHLISQLIQNDVSSTKVNREPFLFAVFNLCLLSSLIGPVVSKKGDVGAILATYCGR